MVRLNKILKKLVYLAVVVLILVVSCIEIISINQPDTATVGETITITLDAEVTGKDGSTLVLGFLAPRSWRPLENTTASFESTIGNSSMSLMPADELDPNFNRPWKEQITERVGIGDNYGDVEWVVFKADNDFIPPDNTSEDNPVTGTITIKTKVGPTNMKAQLGYFLGDALWGYLKDSDNNSTFKFASKCIEIVGAAGSAENLCGPAPRKLVESATFTYDDILTIIFDAQEDSTALIGADKIFYCSAAEHDMGISEVCEYSLKTEMTRTGPDTWRLTLWPRSYYNIPTGSNINGITANFQSENGQTIVVDLNTNSNFQLIPKCF